MPHEKEEVKQKLEELTSLIKARFPNRYKFKIMPFAVEERENVGLDLSIMRDTFGDSRTMIVDLAYLPSNYKYNSISSRDKELTDFVTRLASFTSALT